MWQQILEIHETFILPFNVLSRTLGELVFRLLLGKEGSPYFRALKNEHEDDYGEF
jgi:hypothetical protein